MPRRYTTRSRHEDKENMSVPDSDVTHLLSRMDTMSNERTPGGSCAIYVGVPVNRAYIVDSSSADQVDLHGLRSLLGPER